MCCKFATLTLIIIDQQTRTDTNIGTTLSTFNEANRMMELPEKNDVNDSSANKKESTQQSLGSPSIDKAAAVSAETAEVPASSVEESSTASGGTLPKYLAPVSGKRDNGTLDIIHTGMGIMGAYGNNSAKRGKREWLSYRGSRHSRVGEEYQVASLPPVGGSTQKSNTTNDGEGN